MNTIVIGVAGGSGSGKTTLVRALVDRFGDDITVLSHDNYYKRHDELPLEERRLLNYDHPDAFDTDMASSAAACPARAGSSRSARRARSLSSVAWFSPSAL